MKRYSTHSEYELEYELMQIASSIQQALDEFRETDDGFLFRYQREGDGGQVGFLLHTDLSDALRNGNLGWYLLRSYPNGKVKLTISDFPFPSRGIFKDELGLFNPGIFGPVDWIVDTKDWDMNEEYQQVIPEPKDAEDVYLVHITGHSYSVRYNVHTNVIGAVLNKLKADGLFDEKKSGNPNRESMNFSTAMKMKDLRDERRKRILNGKKIMPKTVACEMVSIHRQTAKKHDPELWLNWKDPNYLG